MDLNSKAKIISHCQFVISRLKSDEITNKMLNDQIKRIRKEVEDSGLLKSADDKNSFEILVNDYFKFWCNLRRKHECKVDSKDSSQRRVVKRNNSKPTRSSRSN